eukprot:133554_1
MHKIIIFCIHETSRFCLSSIGLNKQKQQQPNINTKPLQARYKCKPLHVPLSQPSVNKTKISSLQQLKQQPPNSINTDVHISPDLISINHTINFYQNKYNQIKHNYNVNSKYVNENISKQQSTPHQVSKHISLIRRASNTKMIRPYNSNHIQLRNTSHLSSSPRSLLLHTTSVSYYDRGSKTVRKANDIYNVPKSTLKPHTARRHIPRKTHRNLRKSDDDIMLKTNIKNNCNRSKYKFKFWEHHHPQSPLA